MKTLLAGRWGLWFGLGWAFLIGWGTAFGAEPATDEPPASVAPVAQEAAAAPEPAVAVKVPEERVRLRELVNVGGSARVRTNQVADEVVVVRGDAIIEGDVDGDVVVILGNLKLTGTVRGSVVVVLGEAEIAGTIRDEAVFVGTAARFQSNAVVRGEVIMVGAEPELAEGAKLSGNPTFVSLGPLMRYLGWARDYLFEGVFMLRLFPPGLGWVWGVAGFFLLFHVLLALLFRGALTHCMTTLREQPARSFLVGLLVCILVGPVSVLLSFTVVAVPLLGLLYLVLSIFGRVAVYAAAGAGLGRPLGLVGESRPVTALLLGSVLFYLCYMIPLLGVLVYWVVIPWGVGSVTLCLFDSLRRERRPVGPGRPGTLPGSTVLQGAVSGLAAGQAGPATQATVPPEVERPAGNAADSAGGGVGMGANVDTPPVQGSTVPPLGSASHPPIVTLPTLDLAAAPRVAFWPRFGAGMIDVLLVAFISGLLFSEMRSFWLLFAVYHFAMWAWKGTTLGGSILGLRVIRLDGRALDWQTSLVRLLGAVVSLIPLGLGFMWASWDEQVQSWHDRVAGTVVVKPPRGVTLV